MKESDYFGYMSYYKEGYPKKCFSTLVVIPDKLSFYLSKDYNMRICDFNDKIYPLNKVGEYPKGNYILEKDKYGWSICPTKINHNFKATCNSYRNKSYTNIDNKISSYS